MKIMAKTNTPIDIEKEWDRVVASARKQAKKLGIKTEDDVDRIVHEVRHEIQARKITTWLVSPIIKVYEALGALADNRIKIDGNTAKVYSSSGNKFYTVTYDPTTNSIMCNDNGSYWIGYLGYPAISFLLAKGIIPYSVSSATLLKDIKWKDINQNFKNDFAKTEKYCQDLVTERGGDLPALLADITRIHKYLETHPYPLLGPKIKPPPGY